MTDNADAAPPQARMGIAPSKRWTARTAGFEDKPDFGCDLKVDAFLGNSGQSCCLHAVLSIKVFPAVFFFFLFLNKYDL